MKRKEIKNFAEKIAKCELIIQDDNATSKQKHDAENMIIKLSSHVDSLDDMAQIDELVQDILKKI